MRLTRFLLVIGLIAASWFASGVAAAQPVGWKWSKPVTVGAPMPGVFTTGVPGLFSTGAFEVSCPSVSLCVAVQPTGEVFISHAPGGSADRWRSSQIKAPDGQGSEAPAGLGNVACPDAHLCVATQGDGGPLVSTDPPGGASTWREGQIISAPMLPLTCTRSGRCAFSGFLDGSLACPSAELCAATAFNDGFWVVLTSTRPAAATSRWKQTLIAATRGVTYEGLSCPTVRLCVAITGSEDVVVSTDPAGGPSKWRWVQVTSGPGLENISCASARFCVAGDGAAGDLYVSTDPAGGGSAWRRTKPGFQTLWAACPLVSLCLASQGDEFPFSSADAMAGANSWRPSAVDSAGVLTSISCPTPTECVAGDDEGNVVVGSALMAPRAAGAGPSVIGDLRVGAVLTATTGSFKGTAPIDYEYRWERCDPACVPIAHATSNRYRVVRADAHARIRVRVTAYNSAGSVQADSPQTRPVSTRGRRG